MSEDRTPHTTEHASQNNPDPSDSKANPEERRREEAAEPQTPGDAKSDSPEEVRTQPGSDSQTDSAAEERTQPRSDSRAEQPAEERTQPESDTRAEQPAEKRTQLESDSRPEQPTEERTQLESDSPPEQPAEKRPAPDSRAQSSPEERTEPSAGGKRPASRSAAPPSQPASQSLPQNDDDRTGPDMNSEFAKMLESDRPENKVTDLEVGAKVRGHLVQIGEDTSFVEFGGRSEGAIDNRHLRNQETGEMEYQVGDSLELYVVSNEGDQIELSPNLELKQDVAVDQLHEARRSRLPVKGKVSALNAGGLEVRISGLRAFCPFSQIEIGFCAEPSAYLGQEHDFLVTDIAEGGKNIVVSRRALLRAKEGEKAKETLSTLQEGAELSGRVTRLQPFGAFVNIGGVEGLVHISEISHTRIDHPKQVLKSGQQVKVRVLKLENLDTKKPRISLSIKAALPDPWDDVEEQFWAGKKLTGVVTRLTDFGAFVELVPGIEGLVHVSEVAAKPVKHPKEVLSPKQKVEVTVLNVDTRKRRISLSIRENEMPDAADLKQPAAGEITDGWVAGIKHFGLFVDLPDYGHRARGLVPHEETGEERGAELEKVFNVGDRVKVKLTDVGPDGKIRLSMRRVTEDPQDAPAPAPTSRRSEGGGQGKSQSQSQRRTTAIEDAFRKAMSDQK